MLYDLEGDRKDRRWQVVILFSTLIVINQILLTQTRNPIFFVMRK
jgi:hypothetical protein